MELGLCLPRIIHRDNTLTNIIIRPSCLEACDDYEPDESDDVDSIEADENSINRHMYDLNSWVNGTREWFEVLGSMIAKLTNLNQLTFDGVDPNADYLETFWGEVSESNSLTSMNFANMNLENSEEILCTINASNIRNVMFHNCTLHHEIGYVLRDEVHHHSLTTLHFDECRFGNTNTMREIVEFAGYLALLPSITSLEFTSCALDAEQSMCLVRSLREERVKLELGFVQINCTSSDDDAMIPRDRRWRRRRHSPERIRHRRDVVDAETEARGVGWLDNSVLVDAETEARGVGWLDNSVP
jgi:hypothetical protein